MSTASPIQLEQQTEVTAGRGESVVARSFGYGRTVLLWVLPLVGFFATWELLSRTGVLNPVLIPAPTRVIASVVRYFTSGEIWEHVGVSLQRATFGFAIACAIALPLGLLIGWFRIFDRLVGPVIEVFRQLPPLALFPVMIILFGLGFRAQVAIVVWASVWPVLLNTISGTRQVDPTLVKAAKSLGAGQYQIFRTVVLPSAVPVISTGLRLGGSYALLVLVAAEMIGANSGLGFLIINRQYNFRIPQMYAAITILAWLGLTVNYLLVAFERRMTRWQQWIPD
jgi:NitT/TauT family transport system permease protein